MSQPDPAAGPLSGLFVVSVEQAVAAPYCASRLAEAGARVVKVERPGVGDFARHYDHAVDGESAYFVWLNRGKESAALDLKDPADAALLQAMIAKADVLIQNLAPGAAARAGFGSAEMRTRHPGLITVDISGYGEANPFTDMKAYDLLVQGESGLASVTGSPEAAGRVGVSVCDIACGMYAYQAVLEALIARGATGRGKGIEVSLFSGMADWMTVPLLHHDRGGKAPARVGLAHPSIAPYESFATADGGRIIISIQNEREWATFATDILDRPQWADPDHEFGSNVKRVAARHRLTPAIAEVFARSPTEQMLTRLRHSRIACGRLNDVAALSTHPALERVTVDTPAGPVAMPAPPARVDGALRAPGPVPRLGEHTDRLRAEFG